MATAHVQRDRRTWDRSFPTAEEATEHLVMLLKMAGYSDDPARRLLKGERIRYRNFTYWVE